ncbi:hypothetical protein CANINC_002760 [Pichia inconspicua]|uniref:Uncharacterized protein n=1 Tax=Pichia inconspicua TaxID=52247 RepID=A0A4T0X0C6_9ASCO|nr:hypothetical protein CANINC_002760 [[Candida] inconspicua]
MSLVLSVEETNRLREKAGLRPIPVPVSSSKNEKHLSNGGGSVSKSSLIELSVSETNQLRLKLGLKPIPEEEIDQELQNYAVLQRTTQEKENVANLKSKLDKTKNEIKNSRRLASGGILDRMSTGKTEVLDFDTWLDKIGNEVKIGNIKRLRFKPAKQQTEQAIEPASIKISHDKEQFSEELTKVKQIILTAKDVNVLDDDNDEFENTILKKESEIKSTHKEINNNGKLVALEDGNKTGTFVLKEGDKLEAPVKRKLETLNLELDDNDSDDEGKRMNKFMKRDVSKSKKSKQPVTRRKVFDTVPVSKEFEPLKLDESEGDDDDDELDKVLEEQRKNIFSKSKKILAPVDEVKRDGELFDERLDFIENLQVDQDDSKQESLQNLPIQPKPSEIGVTIGSDRYHKLLESEESNHNTLGVSEILSVLKSNGKLQEGKSESSMDIKYTDDNGKELSTKEAFKYMSRKFHGSRKK